MGFSRQGYWSGLLFPSPGDLPDSGIKPGSLTLQADALPSESPGELFLHISKKQPTNQLHNPTQEGTEEAVSALL